MLSQKEVREMGNKDLLKSLLSLEDLIMVEVNSKRGVTKTTARKFSSCIKEMCKRLDIEYVESDWEN